METGFGGVENENIQIDANDSINLDAVILDNNIRGGRNGIDIFSNNDAPNFLTIGGNKIRKVTNTGILIDADDTLFLGDNGQNNNVGVRIGGIIFDIDNDGDVLGTIEINNVDQVFP